MSEPEHDVPPDCGPLLMLLPPEVHEREYRALRESWSRDPWHAKRAAIEGESHYRRLHASCPLASVRPPSLSDEDREKRRQEGVARLAERIPRPRSPE